MPAPPADTLTLDTQGSRRALLWVLLAAAAAQAFTWSRLDGYQLADSVEYLDRAAAFARGEAFDPATVRSFAFSAVLVPLAALSERLGLDPRWIVPLARLMQMAFGLLAVWVIGRTSERAFGPGTGWIAAAFVAFNPIFLRWSIAPLAASASLLALSLGLAGLERARGEASSSFARGLGSGAWFGVGVLAAYQNLLLVFAVAPFVLLAKRWRRIPHLAGLFLGLVLLLLLQCLLDLWLYGRFGSSLGPYLSANIVGFISSVLSDLGFGRAAHWVYDNFGLQTAAVDSQSAASAGSATTERVLRSQTGRAWYFENLVPFGLSIVAAALVAVGALRALLRPSWFSTLLLFVVVSNVAVMSFKGSKSFRLWMPLLPWMALIAIYGISAAVPRVRRSAALRALSALAVAGMLFGALRGVLGSNLVKFGPYAEAMRFVNESTRAAQPTGELTARPRVASAYDWAARWQRAPWLDFRKLPHHLDRWPQLGPEQRAECLASIGEQDWLVAHLQTFTQDPSIADAINARFEVARVLHDQLHAEELGPVFVFKRRSGDARAHTLFEVFDDTGPGEPNEPGRYQSRLSHPISVDYRRREGELTYQMVLLGYDVERDLAGGKQAWVTLHWYAGPLHGRDFTVVNRFTDREGGAWQHNHQPCYGARPTSTWREGQIVRESYMSRIHRDPLRFGGAWRRGELVPVDMWLAIAEFDDTGQVVGGLNPFMPSGTAPVSKLPRERGYASDQGRVWSVDGLFLVGGFLLPVPAAWRLPDDGRNLPARGPSESG